MMFAEFFTLKVFVPKPLRRGVIYPIYSSQTSGNLEMFVLSRTSAICFFRDSLISEHASLKQPQTVGDIKCSVSAMKRREMD